MVGEFVYTGILFIRNLRPHFISDLITYLLLFTYRYLPKLPLDWSLIEDFLSSSLCVWTQPHLTFTGLICDLVYSPPQPISQDFSFYTLFFLRKHKKANLFYDYHIRSSSCELVSDFLCGIPPPPRLLHILLLLKLSRLSTTLVW